MGDNVITNFRDLIVYKKAFEQALKIFNLTKAFPKDEQYSLTDQIRRSSRSICTNIGEAWRKRRYSAHFVSKLTDSDAEASETMIWLDFALQCGYISSTVHSEFVSEYEQIGKMLGAMIAAPTKFCYNDKNEVLVCIWPLLCSLPTAGYNLGYTNCQLQCVRCELPTVAC